MQRPLPCPSQVRAFRRTPRRCILAPGLGLTLRGCPWQPTHPLARFLALARFLTLARFLNTKHRTGERPAPIQRTHTHARTSRISAARSSISRSATCSFVRCSCCMTCVGDCGVRRRTLGGKRGCRQHRARGPAKHLRVVARVDAVQHGKRHPPLRHEFSNALVVEAPARPRRLAASARLEPSPKTGARGTQRSRGRTNRTHNQQGAQLAPRDTRAGWRWLAGGLRSATRPAIARGWRSRRANTHTM